MLTNSAHVLALSVACIAAGTLLLLFERSEAIAGTLIAAGVGGFSKEVVAAKAKARNETRAREEAQNETRELRRELFEVTSRIEKPK